LANSFAAVCLENVRFPPQSLTKWSILFEPKLHEIFAANVWLQFQRDNAEYLCHDNLLFESY
jgi:hypothetical protein